MKFEIVAYYENEKRNKQNDKENNHRDMDINQIVLLPPKVDSIADNSFSVSLELIFPYQVCSRVSYIHTLSFVVNKDYTWDGLRIDLEEKRAEEQDPRDGFFIELHSVLQDIYYEDIINEICIPFFQMEFPNGMSPYGEQDLLNLEIDRKFTSYYIQRRYLTITKGA